MPIRKPRVVRLTAREKEQRRRFKRKLGPCAMRRKERRAYLQRPTIFADVAEITPPELPPKGLGPGRPFSTTVDFDKQDALPGDDDA